MMHNSNILYAALNSSQLELQEQIDAVKEDARKYIATLPYPDNVTVYQVRNRDGSPKLAALLAAKAQVLSAMAVLKAAEMQQRTKR